MSQQQISAVILAAGMGTRMGATKQLLSVQGSYMLERVIHLALAEPFRYVFAVIGHDADRIQNEIVVRDPRFRWLINHDYQQGQSTSFKLGMEHAADSADAVMILLADQPFIRKQTMEAVFDQGKQLLTETNEPFVVQPTFGQKPGHPVLFGNFPLELFATITGDQGAKPILSRIANRIGLPVNDPAIHLDVDTPEDYEKVKQHT